MSAVTQLPTWAVYVAGIGGPVAALLSFPLTNLGTRRGHKELEDRSQREEMGRNVRWAAELAVSDDPAKASMGVAQLTQLAESKLAGPEEKAAVRAALANVLEPTREYVEQSGPDVEVIELSSWPSDAGPPALPSTEGGGEQDG